MKCIACKSELTIYQGPYADLLLVRCTHCDNQSIGSVNLTRNSISYLERDYTLHFTPKRREDQK